MPITDYFQSMEDVRAYAESLKGKLGTEDYELLLYLLGLTENKGDSETILLQGEQIKIDKFLVPIIIELNRLGYKTLACCSGLQAEHSQSKFGVESGYLALSQDSFLEQLKGSLADPLIELKESECYLQPSLLITIRTTDDVVLKEKWCLVFEALKMLKKDR